MKRPIDTTLPEIAEQTLGDLAFILMMPSEESPPSIVNGVTAIIRFRGPFSGFLKLTVDAGMLPILAANMLGLEDGQSATLDRQYDALRELTNVLCGNLLPAVAGAAAEFDFHPPAILAQGADADIPEGLSRVTSARLALDAGAIEITLFHEKPAASETPADDAEVNQGDSRSDHR
jgi:CheY-specific phosphatase CheX